MTLPLILVTGATGTVGTEMIRHLVKAGHRVRALVRDRAKATKLGPKVELVVGDLDDPASLKPAFASVDEAFVVVNGKDLNRLEGQRLRRRQERRREPYRQAFRPRRRLAIDARYGPGAVARRERTPPEGAGSELDDPSPGLLRLQIALHDRMRRSNVRRMPPPQLGMPPPDHLLKNSDGAQTRGSLQHGHDLGFKDVAQRVGPAPLARRLPLRGQPRVLLDAIGRGDPETLNFDNPDPFAEGIDLVRGRAPAMKIDHVLSNGFGLGGVNASVVLRKM